jgi:cell division protein FtsB
MTLAIIIPFVAVCIALLWFARIYYQQLEQIQKAWSEYFESELQKLKDELARVEQEVKQREDGQ